MLALRDPEQRPLNLAYGAIVIAHLIIVGAASVWYAGHSFGPRFTTDILPFLVYFTAFNFRLPEMFRSSTQIALSVCIAVFAVASLIIHAQGALRIETFMWNAIPNDIDQNNPRAWDWTDPQFARTWAQNRRLSIQCVVDAINGHKPDDGQAVGANVLNVAGWAAMDTRAGIGVDAGCI